MKIAVVAHLKHPIAEPFAGGLEAHTFEMVAGMQRIGQDVILFAAGGSGHGPQEHGKIQSR